MASDKRTIAYKVADAVSRTVGYRVTPGYRNGPRATTQWYLEWVNGLTEKQMAAKIRAAGREVSGYDKDLLELRREADDRHLVAAWLLHHDPARRTLDRSRAGWQARKHFEVTSFPRNLPDDHELWTLVDQAFEATADRDRTWAYDAEAAIVYLADIGVQALRVRRCSTRSTGSARTTRRCPTRPWTPGSCPTPCSPSWTPRSRPSPGTWAGRTPPPTTPASACSPSKPCTGSSASDWTASSWTTPCRPWPTATRCPASACCSVCTARPWVNVHYNYHRPHTAAGNQPPATRLHDGVTNVMASYN